MKEFKVSQDRYLIAAELGVEGTQGYTLDDKVAFLEGSRIFYECRLRTENIDPQEVGALDTEVILSRLTYPRDRDMDYFYQPREVFIDEMRDTLEAYKTLKLELTWLKGKL